MAISPSGHKVVNSELSSCKGLTADLERSTTLATWTNLNGSDPVLDRPTSPSEPTRTPVVAAASTGSARRTRFCGWGRVKSTAATTVRLRIGSGPAYDVPIGRGGWFNYTWFTNSKYKITDQAKVAAYDTNGKIVRVSES